MNKVSNAVLRNVLSIVLGFIMVLRPEIAVNYLVITIGVLFILPGFLSLIEYFNRKKNADATGTRFPIEAAGSIIFGAWMVIMPDFFLNITMYVLGALLVLGGLLRIISLFNTRKWTYVRWGYYVMPALVLLVGIVILAYPFATAAITFTVFGATMIVYGFTGLINNYVFRRENI
ncbi:MAG: DUF308 domain-containing protein [Tannerellaceae bacterium]|jgi:uncharacterized membrane protein HdeD (DUF308 family)|nr:DUF308 domain-containing protein [Tannerellaceae bacterium]